MSPVAINAQMWTKAAGVKVPHTMPIDRPDLQPARPGATGVWRTRDSGLSERSPARDNVDGKARFAVRALRRKLAGTQSDGPEGTWIPR